MAPSRQAALRPATTSSGSSGTPATLQGLGQGTYRLTASGSYGSGYLTTTYPTDVVVAEGSSVDGIDFTLALGGEVSGTVTNAATGAPLAGANVVLQLPPVPDPNGWPGYPQWTSWSATTDAQGHYSIKGVEPGSYLVYAFAEGYINEWHQDAQSSVTATQLQVQAAQTQTVDFALTQPASLDLLVVDASGAPVPGISVTLWTGAGGFGSQTDANGHLALSYVAPGDYVIEFNDWAQGRYPQQFYDGKLTRETADPVTIAPGSALSRTAHLVGSSTPSISGNVTDTSGNPLSGIAVTAYTMSETQAAQTVTDDAGAYTLTGLAAGDYYVQFGTPGTAWIPSWWAYQADSRTALHVSGPVTGVNWSLSPAIEPVTGVITDATSLDPVSGAVVTAWRPGSDTPLASTTTGDDGSYELSLPWGPVQIDVTAGAAYRQTWWVDAATRADAASLEVAGPHSGVDLALHRLPRITGVVTDSVSGLPIVGVSVTATLVGPSTAGAQVTTGADGSYEITGLAPGPYVLSFDDGTGPYITEFSGGVYVAAQASAVELTTAAPWQTVDAALDTPGTITGVVLGKDKDKVKDTVCVQAWAGNDLPVGSPVCVTAGTAYVIAELNPGTYRVSATLRKGEVMWYADATSHAAATDVVVSSGATTTGIDIEAKSKKP